ncbi:hypothetical protein MALGJ_05900 [Mycolicibacter algericus]|uniref:Secreted protein n=2 Tax=Mycolicibacter algericus TaxID=1288388 RepID=A0A7I9Y5Q9_MYCAL|nr:hypothetical protein MALGJ_05900 [Mycolicibacter algericus]
MMVTRKSLVRWIVALACATTALSGAVVVTGPFAQADPSDYARPPEPLPMVIPTPSNWEPKFPFPYDETRGSVTDADINAEREMCQWFNSQYDELMRQIDRFQFNRITPNGPGVISGAGSDWDYSIGDLQQQADIVTANIDQSVEFLAPRAQALTQSTNHAGDVYFPLYQAKEFYLLWQHLSNVNAGIKSHQPDWFTGPSVKRVLRWGTRIKRSHVCR